VRTSRSPVEHTTSTALYQLAVCGAVAHAKRFQVNLRANTDVHQPRLHFVWEASTSCSSLNQKAHACAIEHSLPLAPPPSQRPSDPHATVLAVFTGPRFTQLSISRILSLA